jgi:hypothetical protein
MINDYIQKAIASIEQEKLNAVATIQEKVTKETILPHNVELDTYRDKAIESLTTKLNSDIQALQKTYTEERQKYIEATEASKAKYAEEVIAQETKSVEDEYDTAIAKLKSCLGSEE